MDSTTWTVFCNVASLISAYFAVFAVVFLSWPLKKRFSTSGVSSYSCPVVFVSCCVVVCPSVVKTRLQLLRKGVNEETYSGVVDCAR